MSIHVLVIGTGEYVTGHTHGRSVASDKQCGVILPCLVDLHAHGKVSRVTLCGRDGSRFAAIRERQSAGVSGFDALPLQTLPADDANDDEAWRGALEQMVAGDAVIICTPDDTHATMASTAAERGLHVLVVKPLARTLAEHHAIHAAAHHAGVLIMVEHHKRFDPFYADARQRIRTSLGPFSHFASYMSQPRKQLDTFRAWAGRGSDISYYLNSHHIDFLAWCLAGRAAPRSVSAVAARGVASALLGVPGVEDTITLSVEWENNDHTIGTSIHTASWIAPESDVHSQQRFHYMGHAGEVQIDQAHRGYTYAVGAADASGLQSANPLYLQRTIDAAGRARIHGGYGHASIASFIDAAAALQAGSRTVEQLAATLPTVADTFVTTAILEAGRRSLDAHGAKMLIGMNANGVPVHIEPVR